MRSKTIKKVIAAAVVAAMGITSIVPAAPAQAAKKTNKLTVKTKKITLYKGAAAGYGSLKLKVTVKPKKAKVTYKINKKKIASVSKKGLVKAKKPGKAKITVKSGNKKVVVKVVVKKIKKKVTKVTAPKNVTVKVGAKQKIKTSVKPKKATLKKLTFKSSAKKIAKVNAKGVITGVKAGKAKITVKAVDGSKKKATVSVVVTAAAIASNPAVTTGGAVATKTPATVAPTATAPTTTAPATGEPTTAPTDEPTTAPTEAPTAAPELKEVKVPEIAEGESYKVTFGGDTLNVSEADIAAATSLFEQKADKIKANLAVNFADKYETFKAKSYKANVNDFTYSKAAGSDVVTIEKNGKKVDVKTTLENGVVSVAATGAKSFSFKAEGSASACKVTDVVIGGKTYEGTFEVATEIAADNTVTVKVADTAEVVVKEGKITSLKVAEKYAKDLKIEK